MPTRARRSEQTQTPQESILMTDVATQVAGATPATVEADATPNGSEAAAPTGKSRKNTAPIQITVPLDLKTIIEQRAETDKAPSSARWVLEQVARILEYTLPAPTRTSTGRGGVKMTDVFAKDLTPDQKRERMAQAKTLLEGLRKGIIDLDDIKAKLGVS